MNNFNDTGVMKNAQLVIPVSFFGHKKAIKIYGYLLCVKKARLVKYTFYILLVKHIIF